MRKLTVVLLGSVFLIVIAGSVVRATGSGMGCPDWPKCFGYYIPPTQKEEVTWAPNQSFFQGQFILHRDNLWKAKADFLSGENYNPQNWELFDEHSYAYYNPTHTWIEYLNRMVGVLSGFIGLGLWVFTLIKRPFQRKLFLNLSLFMGIMFFQAWLGALVVESVLSPVKITIHMVFALLILFLNLIMVREQSQQKQVFPFSKKMFNLYLIIVGIFVIQVILGTQVRQFVDAISHTDISQINRNNLFDDAPARFYIHRTLSLFFALSLGYFIYRLKKEKLMAQWSKIIYFILGFTLVQIGLGLWMAYISFDIWTQPAHLVVSTLMFIVIGIPLAFRQKSLTQ